IRSRNVTGVQTCALPICDAAGAVVAALATPTTGVFNIVDDAPTKMGEWLPELAARLGAPAPRRAPTFLARAAVGGWGVAFMTQRSEERRVGREGESEQAG